MKLKHSINRFRKHRDEKKLLEEINAGLPKHVDWKKGAEEYFSSLLVTAGLHNRRYEQVKPFQGGPEYTDFYQDMYMFVNTLETLKLPQNAVVLDVGCGGGWVSHYLAKLGFHVTGIDICDELLAIARERVEADMFPPYLDKPLHVEFLKHDMETSLLPEGEPFDCVLFMSALHHFYNPIQAIRNATHRLKPDGCLVIVESSAPEPGSQYDKTNKELMEKYKTLERPLSRTQIWSVLDVCDFPHRRAWQPVNGFFQPDQETLAKVCADILKQNWNCITASRIPNRVTHFSNKNRVLWKDGSVDFLAGFFGPEREEGWGEYRWAGPEAYLETQGTCSEMEIELQCVFMDPEKERMKVFIKRDGTIQHHLILTRSEPSKKLVLSTTETAHRFAFMADTVFRPDWFGIPDTRLLSFKLQLSDPGSS